MPYPSIFAIDGPVASGKTTVGRELARQLGYRFVDTGMLYRALAYCSIQAQINPSEGKRLVQLAHETRFTLSAAGEMIFCDGVDVTEHLRTPQVEEIVSLVAKVKAVRQELLGIQRSIAEEGNVVMVGRDIGTIVVPDAAKIFLEASLDERIRRRFTEVQAKGSELSRERIKLNLQSRDTIDSERDEAPLRVAEGSVVIPTGENDVEGVVGHILQAFTIAEGG
ncbi:MAG: cytidylate kinase [Dehalococcoidia bacterium]|nr:cytidylate kinase [Dehalococcoidia bacterium]